MAALRLAVSLWVAAQWSTAQRPALPMVSLEGIGAELPTRKEEGKRRGRLRLEALGSGEEPNLFVWPVESRDIDCTVKVHGHSSAAFTKKSFTVKLKRETGEKLKAGFGPGWRESDGFDLFGPYADRSLIRNALAYSLANDMGVWAPRFSFIDLFYKNETALDYRGVYMILELVKRDRLDLHQGDMLISYDWPNSNVDLRHAWQSGASAFVLEYPKDKVGPGEPVQTALPQMYVPPAGTKAYAMADILNTSMGISGSPPDLSLVDDQSWANFFIFNELSANVDGYKFSTFLRVKDGKLLGGPVWDQDLAFGNANDNGPDFGVDHWQWAKADSLGSLVAKFVHALLSTEPGKEKPSFSQLSAMRWFELRNGVLSDEALQQRISDYVFLLNASGAVERNFEVWGPINGPLRVDPDGWPYIGRTDPSRTWETEILFVRGWLQRRLQFLDENFRPLDTWSPSPPSSGKPSDGEEFRRNVITIALFAITVATLSSFCVPALLWRIAAKLASIRTPPQSPNAQPLLQAEEEDEEARPEQPPAGDRTQPDADGDGGTWLPDVWGGLCWLVGWEEEAAVDEGGSVTSSV